MSELEHINSQQGRLSLSPTLNTEHLELNKIADKIANAIHNTIVNANWEYASPVGASELYARNQGKAILSNSRQCRMSPSMALFTGNLELNTITNTVANAITTQA